jgi:Phage integrase family
MKQQRRNQNHRVNLASRLHIFRHTKTGRWMVYHRPVGGPPLKLYSDPARPSKKTIAELYERHVRQGEPFPVAGEAGASIEGSWGFALDLYTQSLEFAALARPGAYKAAINYLRDKCGRHPMRLFEPWMVEKLWQECHRDRGHGAANGLRTVLSKVIAIGKKRGWVRLDLLGDIKKIASPTSYRPWHPSEVERWRLFYPNHASVERRTLELLYELGARGRSDATRLSWADTRIDPDASAREGLPADTLWIRYTQKKTREPVDRPILGEEFLECLRHCPRDGGVVGLNGLTSTPWLVSPATGRAFSHDHFSVYWRRWRDAAGLPADFTPHGARKSLAADALSIGVNPNDSRHLTGHSLEVHMEYAKTHDHQRGAARAAVALAAGRKRRAA